MDLVSSRDATPVVTPQGSGRTSPIRLTVPTSSHITPQHSPLNSPALTHQYDSLTGSLNQILKNYFRTKYILLVLFLYDSFFQFTYSSSAPEIIAIEQNIKTGIFKIWIAIRRRQAFNHSLFQCWKYSSNCFMYGEATSHDYGVVREVFWDGSKRHRRMSCHMIAYACDFEMAQSSNYSVSLQFLLEILITCQNSEMAHFF